jgi:hypothetical protein
MISPLLSVGIAALAVRADGVSEEARQTAAQVRSSLLTHDWTWLQEGIGPGILNTATREQVDRFWSVLFGLARWTVASPDLDVLRFRSDMLAEASTVFSQSRLYQSAFYEIVTVAGTENPPPEGLEAKEGRLMGWKGVVGWPIPSFQRRVFNFPSWGPRPRNLRQISSDFKSGNVCFSWDTREDHVKRLLISGYSFDIKRVFFEIIELKR